MDEDDRSTYIGLAVNIALLLGLVGAGAWYYTKPAVADTSSTVTTSQTSTPKVEKPVAIPAITATEIIAETNVYRAQSGKAPLTENALLDNSACAKVQHMIDNNYWNHIAPDGTTPWYFFEQAGYVYDKSGENLAYGFTSSYAVVQGWINSPTHERNLSNAYIETGVCVKPVESFMGKTDTSIVVAHYGVPK